MDTGHVSLIAWSPDGRQFASGSSYRTVQICNTGTGACEKTLKGHRDPLSSIAWSLDGRRLASRSMIIRISDPSTGDCTRIMEGHIDSISPIAWSPDGKRLASVSRDYSIRIWDVDSGVCQNIIQEHTKANAPITWSRNGQTIASGFRDKIVRIWEVSTGSCMRECDSSSNLFSPGNFESIPIDWISDKIQDRSRLFGIECQKLSINGAQACALVTKSDISFFKLMGEEIERGKRQ